MTQSSNYLLPPYVYDLIAAVQKWEDEHSDTSEYFDAILSAIPKQELDRAAAIAHYQRENARVEEQQRRDDVARRQLSSQTGGGHVTPEQMAHTLDRTQRSKPGGLT